MHNFFSIDREIDKADVTPEVAYALCYLNDHITSSSADCEEEFLAFTKALIHSQVRKWLAGLFYANRPSRAIPSLKQLHRWIVSSISHIRTSQ